MHSCGKGHFISEVTFLVTNLKQKAGLSTHAESAHKGVKDVPLVEFMYIVFTCMPSESYCRQLRSLLFVLCILRTE